MVECQIVTLVVTGSSPVIYPLHEIKKINTLVTTHANNIYCTELKKFTNIKIMHNAELYKNIAISLNNIYFENIVNINKTLINLNCDKTPTILELAKFQKKKINFFQKFNYYTFYTFYEIYTTIFITNATFNLTNFKFSSGTGKLKKIIHLNINLIKSQPFLSVNNSFKKITSWNISLGVLLKTSSFSKNSRRTKFGFDFLLKFLKKKIKLLLNLSYVIAFTVKGHKKIINSFINWLIQLVPSAKTAFLLWLPCVSYKNQKKKKYAAIKKNLKKRLLKIK